MHRIEQLSKYKINEPGIEVDILFSMLFEARIKTRVVKRLRFYENRVGTKQFIDNMFCGLTCEDDCVDVILDVFIQSNERATENSP